MVYIKTKSEIELAEKSFGVKVFRLPSLQVQNKFPPSACLPPAYI